MPGHDAPVVRCPHCQQRRPARFTTDGHGRDVDITPPCTCPKGRKAGGICQNCPKPVEGMVGRALRCRRCKQEARREGWRRYDRQHAEKRRAYDRQRWRNDPAHRIRKRQLRRERAKTPEEQARRREYRRRREVRNTKAVLEERRRTEARPERKAARLKWAHENQTKYVGPRGIKPTCATCGVEVPYSGRGRPHKQCSTCDPKAWARTQPRRGHK